MNAKQSYVLAKRYTDKSIIGLGSIKGANCTIKSVTKKDGITTIVFEWLANDNVTKETTEVKVADGTPIYEWQPNTFYDYGALAIYESVFYRCIYENSDHVFNPLHWNAIGQPDSSYGIVQSYGELPERMSASDRKIYFVIDDDIYYLWDGTQWNAIEPKVEALNNQEVNELISLL